MRWSMSRSATSPRSSPWAVSEEFRFAAGEVKRIGVRRPFARVLTPRMSHIVRFDAASPPIRMTGIFAERNWAITTPLSFALPLSGSKNTPAIFSATHRETKERMSPLAHNSE